MKLFCVMHEFVFWNIVETSVKLPQGWAANLEREIERETKND